MAERREMPPWGWGDPDHERHLTAQMRSMVAARLGDPADAVEPARLERFVLPEGSTLDVQRILTDSIASLDVDSSLERRVLRGAGKSYPDLVRMWDGRPDALPDAVVTPDSEEQIAALFDLCGREGIAIVPFGGGTSVVGGVAPLKGRHLGAVALDMCRFDKVHSVDVEGEAASLGAGLLAPAAEDALGRHGVTLGHFPQSFEQASLGGFAATRSSGQASTRYGRFDWNVLGFDMVTPSGHFSAQPAPGTAAGPDLRQLAIGSEGTLGVFTRLDMRVWPVPARIEDRAWIVEGFDQGVEVLRLLEQSGCAPAVTRLSDEPETEVNLTMASASRGGGLLASYARRKGRGRPCFLITGFEGGVDEVDWQLSRASAILKRSGAAALGSVPAKAWRKGRFHGPYLRDVLMAHGLLVDTLETAIGWTGIGRLHAEVGRALTEALAKHGGEPLVMCHVSHVYPTGASLYFTFVGNQPASETEGKIANWHSVKAAACDAIAASGGTITHHHAVGVDHLPWLAQEVGTAGAAALKALKESMDPAGIMNPGKLVPAA